MDIYVSRGTANINVLQRKEYEPKMDLAYILAGLEDPSRLDTDATRHKIAWRRGERIRKTVMHHRSARTATPSAEPQTPNRPEAYL